MNLQDIPWKLVTLACVFIAAVTVVAIFDQSQLAPVVALATAILGSFGVITFNQGRQQAQLTSLHVTTNGNTKALMDQNAALTRALAASPALDPATIAAVFPAPAPAAAAPPPTPPTP